MDKPLIIGRVGAPYGVKGFVKVISFTQPQTNILNYQPWRLHLRNNWQEIVINNARTRCQDILVQFVGCDDREVAKTYTHAEIAITRAQLPTLTEGHYWADLVGLTVINTRQEVLGVVQCLLETGANDVLIVKGQREQAIPYRKEVILQVDLAKKVLLVDWDAEF